MQGSRTRAYVLTIAGLFAGAAIIARADVSADPVVIELGDTVVTRSELDRRFEIAVRLLARRQGVTLAGQDPGLIGMLREQYLDKRASELVMLEEARRRQLLVSDAQVDAAFGEVFSNSAEIDELLAGTPMEASRARALLEEIIREEQTVELLTEQMLREIRIPPGDVITMHHDVKHALATPETVCVRHIQVAEEAAAGAIRKELESGADFATIAAEQSNDVASAAAGGDLGCFERGAAGPRTEFERVAFATSEGELAGPVESRYGYHVLLIYRHDMPREPTLNEAYAQIERELALEQLPERIRALMEKSGVRVYPDRFS